MDICCGTGSIGIALADRFDKVYGIEMVQSAIDDANMNIKKNNLENCIFECGKAENRMRDISIEVSKVNYYCKVGCVVRMVVDSILLHAECGPNDHRKDAPPFNGKSFLEQPRVPKNPQSP